MNTRTFEVTCPCCRNEITVEFYSGTPAVWYPNDKAHPGDPPTAEVIEGCECSETMDHLYRKSAGRFVSAFEWYHERLFEEIGDPEAEARSIAADLEYDRRIDDSLMEKDQ